MGKWETIIYIVTLPEKIRVFFTLNLEYSMILFFFAFLFSFNMFLLFFTFSIPFYLPSLATEGECVFAHSIFCRKRLWL